MSKNENRDLNKGQMDPVEIPDEFDPVEIPDEFGSVQEFIDYLMAESQRWFKAYQEVSNINKNKLKRIMETKSKGIIMETKSKGIIEAVKREHLCSIEFLEDSIKIKKQLGNNTGSQIEIEFKDSSKRIQNIKFTKGGYNEPLTLKQEFDTLFNIIFNY